MKSPVAGVLIGGQSLRMGTPKHLISHEGTTFVERSVNTLSGLCDPVVVVGQGELPPSLEKLQRLDDSPEYRGPLAGIVSLMKSFPDRPVLVVGCDLPNLTHKALQWLIDWLGPENKSVIPHDDQGHIQSCFALYQSNLLPIIESGNVSAPKDLVSLTHVISPLVPSALNQALQNVNTTADLKRLTDG